MWFVGQLLMIPVAALVYGVELLVKTLHGMQDATSQGLEAVVGGGQVVQVESSPQTVESGAGGPQTIDVGGGNAGLANTGTTQKEENTLSNEGGIIGLDKDLHDDMLKLVRYKILFVKREYEHAFPEKEDLVSDNMDGNAFTAWKVAEFIQELQSKDREKTRVPKKWADKHYPGGDYSADSYLTGLPEGDKKYLRVYYEVLDRYPIDRFTTLALGPKSSLEGSIGATSQTYPASGLTTTTSTFSLSGTWNGYAPLTLRPSAISNLTHSL